MSAYDDIIDLARPISKTRPRMSARERAAQFAPFAALAGYGELISESQRDTLEKRPLSSGEAEKLNRRLIKLTQLIAQRPRIRISCFVPDGKKRGAWTTAVWSLRTAEAYPSTTLAKYNFYRGGLCQARKISSACMPIS